MVSYYLQGTFVESIARIMNFINLILITGVLK